MAEEAYTWRVLLLGTESGDLQSCSLLLSKLSDHGTGVCSLQVLLVLGLFIKNSYLEHMLSSGGLGSGGWGLSSNLGYAL